MAILPDVSAELVQLKAMIATQAAQIEAMKSAKSANRGITFRINNWKAGDLDTHGKPREKDGARGITVTGINRNGMTFYASEWQRLAPHMPALMKFIDEHKSELSWKDQS